MVPNKDKNAFWGAYDCHLFNRAFLEERYPRLLCKREENECKKLIPRTFNLLLPHRILQDPPSSSKCRDSVLHLDLLLRVFHFTLPFRPKVSLSVWSFRSLVMYLRIWKLSRLRVILSTLLSSLVHQHRHITGTTAEL